MKTIDEVFPNGIDDIQKYVPDLASSIAITTLTAAYHSAYQRVGNVIGEVFIDSSLEDGSLKSLVQGCLACFTIYEQAPFMFAGRDKNYRYQEVEMKDRYISSGWAFVNALITALDAAGDSRWLESDCYQDRQNLLFKNQNDFDRYYAIDKSAYFFSKIVFLIREQSSRYLPSRVKLADLAGSSGLAEALKYYVAYSVIYRAVIQFDVSELTKSLRHDINHEFTKYPSVADSKDKLLNLLGGKADEYEHRLEIAIQRHNGTFADGDIENPNNECKKYYFMR